MNACANCHGNSHGGAFRLTRSYDSAVLNRKTLQQNLAAVLAEVNPDQPRSSPLLSKAVSVHGPLDQAPIKNRQSAAYRTLEDWVKATLADNPQLHDRPSSAAAPAGRGPARRLRRTDGPARQERGRSQDVGAADRAAGREGTARAGGPVQPRRL